MNYEKILKRELRYSKIFKINKEINIIGIKSNTFEFSKNIIDNIIKKNNINKKINYIEYNNILDIKFPDNKSILILPIEGIFLSFIMYFYKKDDKYKIFIYKNTEKFYNIGYKISEYYISKIMNKEPLYFDNNKKILEFIYKYISRNEKYVMGLSNIIMYLSTFI